MWYGSPQGPIGDEGLSKDCAVDETKQFARTMFEMCKGQERIGIIVNGMFKQ